MTLNLSTNISLSPSAPSFAGITKGLNQLRTVNGYASTGSGLKVNFTANRNSNFTELLVRSGHSLPSLDASLASTTHRLAPANVQKLLR